MFGFLARVLGWLVLLYGLAMVGGGFAIASDIFGPRAEVMARYWPNRTTGEMIDSGVPAILAGVGLAALGEVAAKLRKLMA